MVSLYNKSRSSILMCCTSKYVPSTRNYWSTLSCLIYCGNSFYYYWNLSILNLYFLDVNNLIKAVKSVTKSTRSARTVVWCAVQMLYANCATSNNNSNDNSPSGDWWCNVINDKIMVVNWPIKLPQFLSVVIALINGITGNHEIQKGLTDSCARYDMMKRFLSFFLLAGLLYSLYVSVFCSK